MKYHQKFCRVELLVCGEPFKSGIADSVFSWKCDLR